MHFYYHLKIRHLVDAVLENVPSNDRHSRSLIEVYSQNKTAKLK